MSLGGTLGIATVVQKLRSRLTKETPRNGVRANPTFPMLRNGLRELTAEIFGMSDVKNVESFLIIGLTAFGSRSRNRKVCLMRIRIYVISVLMIKVSRTLVNKVENYLA